MDYIAAVYIFQYFKKLYADSVHLLRREDFFLFKQPFFKGISFFVSEHKIIPLLIVDHAQQFRDSGMAEPGQDDRLMMVVRPVLLPHTAAEPFQDNFLSLRVTGKKTDTVAPSANTGRHGVISDFSFLLPEHHP